MLIFAESSLRFLKFLIVGAFGAICYLAGSYMLAKHGFEAWSASFIVYAVLIPIVYIIQKRFVFDSKKSHLNTFPRYLSVQLIGLGVSGAVPFLLAKLDLGSTLSFLFVVLVITFTNYLLQLNWTFSENGK